MNNRDENLKEINKKIGYCLFNLLITLDSNGNYKVMDSDKNFLDLPNYIGDIDKAYSIVDFFKKKGYFVSISYVEKNNNIFWITKISKGKNQYDSGLRKTISESICYAALSFIDKNNFSSREEKPPNNIVTLNFKNR